MDDDIADSYLLDAVITVVDAKHGNQQLDEHTEAQAQVGFADRILMSKTDLVSTEEQEALRQRLCPDQSAGQHQAGAVRQCRGCRDS